MLLFMVSSLVSHAVVLPNALEKRQSCNFGDAGCKASSGDNNACCCEKCDNAHNNCAWFCHCACDCYT
ncbi:hypothetical protein F8M41_017419 [Gigaspora margarita]|uniref:Uncharacterized protein n=1 Tax=Gigaspora margarita TaxID=4874 RepID=A0A8H4B5N8_GIGMA|nr:hypothetical protein F8M41_017419 [Gigaspora margarita]